MLPPMYKLLLHVGPSFVRPSSKTLIPGEGPISRYRHSREREETRCGAL